jgi:hypothetical protein
MSSLPFCRLFSSSLHVLVSCLSSADAIKEFHFMTFRLSRARRPFKKRLYQRLVNSAPRKSIFLVVDIVLLSTVVASPSIDSRTSECLCLHHRSCGHQSCYSARQNRYNVCHTLRNLSIVRQPLQRLTRNLDTN